MISKHYSKMALIAVAAASLVFAGCGGKKDEGMTNLSVKSDAAAVAAAAAPSSAAIAALHRCPARPSR